MRVVVSKCASLLGGLFCPGNDVLLRDGLNPKARRKVCQVCDESDKGTAGVDVRPALTDLSIEMGNHGNEKVCRMSAPEPFEQTD